MNNIELLAPVSDFESLQTAIIFGANAVYLGTTSLGLRANAAYFDKDKLYKAVEFAHKFNVKVYVTFNVVPLDTDLKNIDELLEITEKAEVDGYIVSDLGIFSEIKRLVSNPKIHISTQAGVTNSKTANAFFSLGAKRIVLARELTLDNIKHIRNNIDKNLELETFVHGSMCVSFSGRCLLSQYFNAKDANRGECTQPCRWPYYLMERNRKGEYYPIFEEDGSTYILNSYDLCLIEHLDKLMDCGVNSFKIEGRAKSAYYVGIVINAYRQAINILINNKENYKVPKEIVDELDTISHRPYYTGFLFGKDINSQNYDFGGYIKKYDFIAIVNEDSENFIYCSLKNKIQVGDTIEIIQPSNPVIKIKIDNLYNSDKKRVSLINTPKEDFYFSYNGEIKKGSLVRKSK